MKKICVEQGLSSIADFLNRQGYSVEVLGADIESNTSKLNSFDAILVAGYDSNMLGISDTSTKAPVINVEGLTPDEIKQALSRQIGE